MINEILIGIAVIIVSIYFIKWYFVRKVKKILSIENVLALDNPIVHNPTDEGLEIININAILREKEEKRIEEEARNKKPSLWFRIKAFFSKKPKKEDLQNEVKA